MLGGGWKISRFAFIRWGHGVRVVRHRFLPNRLDGSTSGDSRTSSSAWHGNPTPTKPWVDANPPRSRPADPSAKLRQAGLLQIKSWQILRTFSRLMTALGISFCFPFSFWKGPFPDGEGIGWQSLARQRRVHIRFPSRSYLLHRSHMGWWP